MLSSEFRRNPEKVIASLKELGSTLVTLTGCKVYFPVSFESFKLAVLDGSDVRVTGAFIIVLDDLSYGLMNVNTKIKLTPGEINKVYIDDEQYYELVFDKGSIVTDTLECLKDDVLTYYIFHAFVSCGEVPWYYNYDDICHLFDTAKDYANANVGNSPEIVGIMMSLISRDNNDRTVFYRQVMDRKGNSNRLAFIPLNSVEFGATNTLNKLGGNYFDKGVTSALTQPTTSVELIEDILRA